MPSVSMLEREARAINAFDAQGLFVGSAADCFTRGWIVYRSGYGHNTKLAVASQAEAEQTLRKFGAVTFTEVEQ